MGQIFCGIKKDKLYTINNNVYKKERCIGEGGFLYFYYLLYLAYSYVYLVRRNNKYYALVILL